MQTQLNKTLAGVYFSANGNTRQLVESCLGGAVAAGVTTTGYAIEGQDIVEGRFVNDGLVDSLASYHGILFATPTYMGGPAAQFKAFADATSEIWTQQQWSGKVAAGLTCGSSLNGEQSVTLQYLMALACQHGMIWVSVDAACGHADHGINRMGCQLGVVSHVPGGCVDDRDLRTAEYLGRRLAKLLLASD